jgi:Ala-tRNA(Pro) deacylase
VTRDGLALYREILRLLESRGCPYRELVHDPVSGAQEAARARGTPLAMGAKSILFKIDEAFHVLALSAARELRSRRLRQALGAQRTRFATAEELSSLTGLEPGAVPPFGRPLLPFDLLADASLLELPEVAFTPGVRDRSLILATEDWRQVARPRVLSFSR